MTNLNRISPVLTASLLVALTACEVKKVEAPVNTSTQSNTPATDLLHSRAVEAVIWGMPAVNYDLMLQEMLNKTSSKQNEIVYWSRPADWKNQTLRPIRMRSTS
jgi:hypothetical protein